MTDAEKLEVIEYLLYGTKEEEAADPAIMRLQLEMIRQIVGMSDKVSDNPEDDIRKMVRMIRGEMDVLRS